MERFKRFFLLAASLGLLAVIVTVLGTKEARGTLVATLVQVVNDAAHPMPSVLSMYPETAFSEGSHFAR